MADQHHVKISDSQAATCGTCGNRVSLKGGPDGPQCTNCGTPFRVERGGNPQQRQPAPNERQHPI